METPVVSIEPTEFAEVHGKKLSLDEYVALRTCASHHQALEVLMMGNIRAMTYRRCIYHGEKHEDIVDFADNSDMKRTSFSLTPRMSAFDSMVRDYVCPGVTLRDAFIANLHDIPNGSRTYDNVPTLREILQHTTIEELAHAWQQLTPRMNWRTFLRYIVAGENPQTALGLLHH